MILSITGELSMISEFLKWYFSTYQSRIEVDGGGTSNGIYNGYNSSISGTTLMSYNQVFGGNNNYIFSNVGQSDRNFIIAGDNTRMYNQNKSGIYASSTATIDSTTSGNHNFITFTETGSITGTTGSQWNSIHSSNNSNIYLTTGDYNTIIGGNSSTISGTTNARNLIGYSNTSRIIGTASSSNTILGGSSHQITGTTGTNNNTIVGGNGVWIFTETGDYNTALGSQNGSISGTGISYGLLLGGRDTEILGGAGGYQTSIGGRVTEIRNSPSGLTINAFGGSNLASSTSYLQDAQNSSLIQVTDCYISGSTGMTSQFNSIQNASSSYIEGGERNAIFNGLNNNISGTTDNSTLLSSQSSSIGGGSNIVGIGLNGKDVNGFLNGTTVTDTLFSFGQTYGGTYDYGSGDNFSIDWNLGGNIHQLSMSGDTQLSFDGLINGAQYTLVVNNEGTYNITGATAAGFTIKCEGGVLPNITNNGTDICVITTIGNIMYVRHFAGFATP